MIIDHCKYILSDSHFVNSIELKGKYTYINILLTKEVLEPPWLHRGILLSDLNLNAVLILIKQKTDFWIEQGLSESPWIEQGSVIDITLPWVERQDFIKTSWFTGKWGNVVPRFYWKFNILRFWWCFEKSF